LPEHFQSPSNTTKAGLIDALAAAERVIMRPKETPSVITFNSLNILSNELGNLLPAYDGEFMATLTDIYDCTPYEERRRSSKTGPLNIKEPQFNLFAATTPSHLNDFLPPGAFEKGFLSRCFLVYSGQEILRPLFDMEEANAAQYKDIVLDLKHISRLYGEIKFERASADAITSWHLGGRHPVPGHPKLRSYNVRRTVHLLKLCMIACVSDTDSMIISLDHYQTALDWLLEAESFMPDIFKSMAAGGDAKAIEECWYFCFQLYARKSVPVPEAKLYQFLQERVPAHSVERMIDVMCRAGILKKVDVSKIGPCYVPKEKHKPD